MAQHSMVQQGTAGHSIARRGTAWHGVAWHGTAGQTQHGAARRGTSPTRALQALRHLGGVEDVHQFGAVVDVVEAVGPRLPGEESAVSGARAVPEGRDGDDAGGRRRLHQICAERGMRGAAPGPPPARRPPRPPRSPQLTQQQVGEQERAQVVGGEGPLQTLGREREGQPCKRRAVPRGRGGTAAGRRRARGVPVTPALFTSTSRRFSSRSTSRAKARTEASELLSSRRSTTLGLPVAARISSAAAWPRSRLRHARMVRAFLRARSMATHFPIPVTHSAGAHSQPVGSVPSGGGSPGTGQGGGGVPVPALPGAQHQTEGTSARERRVSARGRSGVLRGQDGDGAAAGCGKEPGGQLVAACPEHGAGRSPGARTTARRRHGCVRVRRVAVTDGGGMGPRTRAAPSTAGHAGDTHRR